MVKAVLFCSILSFCSAAALVAPVLAQKSLARPIALAAVSSSPQKHIEYGQLLADYLNQNLTGTQERGLVKVASSIEELSDWFNNNEVDLATETVFSALKIQALSDVEFVARRWKKGTGEYKSIFITHQNSGVQTMQDLKGKKIIFEDPSSSSGYFIPASLLNEAGLKLHHLTSISSTVPKHKVGYFFADEQLNTSKEINITAWVYKQRAAAGFYSDGDWNNPTTAPKSMRDQLRTFHSSTYFPRALMMLRKNLPEETKSKIKAILLNADKHIDGKSALSKYQRTTKFDALDGQSLKAIERAKQLFKIIEREKLTP